MTDPRRSPANSPDGEARPARFAPSARARIVGWSMLLVAIALAGSVLVSAQVLLSRVDAILTAELEHEGDKLRSYAASPDPRTDAPFSDVADLLTGFLSDNLPETNETFFTVIDGVADRRSPQPPLARLDLDPDVVARVAAIDQPTAITVASAAGEALVGVYPVRVAGDDRAARLAVVEFVAPERAQAWSIIRLLAIIGFGSLLAAAVAAWLIAGRVLRPIRHVRLTAERIGESDLSSRITVTGDDDVAQLARTFNRMLDRLQVAFDTRRNFLNDIGHELRTPLTVVRGHLELLDDDPEERAQTVELLLDEVDRMRRLVDDLTTLAQTDRPDFLRAGRVELADLVIELIAKASALAPRRWHIDAVADAAVYADEQRLTQALMQLCANAVQQTGPEDVIAAGSSVTDGVVRLWVRDTGPGVAHEDRERIFARAQRGQGAEPGTGAGLGLAIVTAIADTHGGRVELDSEPGFGATFTLVFPAIDPDARGTDKEG